MCLCRRRQRYWAEVTEKREKKTSIIRKMVAFHYSVAMCYIICSFVFQFIRYIFNKKFLFVYFWKAIQFCGIFEVCSQFCFWLKIMFHKLLFTSNNSANGLVTFYFCYIWKIIWTIAVFSRSSANCHQSDLFVLVNAGFYHYLNCGNKTIACFCCWLFTWSCMRISLAI